MTYRDTSIEGRFLSGDLEAVGAVVRWIAVVVASPRFRLLRSEWRDLHQDVMCRITESLRRGRFDDAQDFKAYVQAVARYTMFHAMSAHHRRGPAVAAGERGADVVPTVEVTVASHQMAKLAIDRSSPGCRELFQAYFFEQRSYSEIARALGVPVGTVKSRLARCLESVQESLRRARPVPRPPSEP